MESQKKLLLHKREVMRSLGNSKTILDNCTRIEYALKRIEEGAYGICCHCGDEIEEDRLSQIPETPFCVWCAEEREIQKNRKR